MIFLPFKAYCDEAVYNGRVSVLNQGQPAPFQGILFDFQADAYMQSMRELEKNQAVLKHDFDLAKLKTDDDLVLGNCKIEKEADAKKFELVTQAKDKQIEELNKIKTSKDYHVLWFVFGVFAGAGLTYGSVYVIQKL